AMVFQEPMTALNPLYTIGKQIAESLRLHEGLRPGDARERGIALLRRGEQRVGRVRLHEHALLHHGHALRKTPHEIQV
ncbi:hypothetical protein QM306_40925, partial [Burkholderia cenocepacia]|nr:hypothetical protein [Burkholderia cenocepacia]